nr:hypothetical protein 76 [bacterium]
MELFYRAMPIDADYIRPGDYITRSHRFAIDHAITSSVYHGEDYGVFSFWLEGGQYEEADNPGEYRYAGEERLKARLRGIAKYDDFSANSEYSRVSGIRRTASQARIQNLLILIHPDSAYELPADVFSQYVEAIKSEVPKFDHVITNFLFSYGYTDIGYVKKMPNREKLIELRRYLESTTEHSHDTEMGRAIFQDLEELLIENEDLNIYIAGGYQDLCLADSYSNFCNVLDWIVEEMGHKVMVYKPLVYYRRTITQEEPQDIIDEEWWKDLEHSHEFEQLASLSLALRKMGHLAEAGEVLSLIKLADRRGAIKRLGTPKHLANYLQEVYGKNSYQIAKWLKEYYTFDSDATSLYGKDRWLTRLRDYSQDGTASDFSELIDFFYDLLKIDSEEKRIELYLGYELIKFMGWEWHATNAFGDNLLSDEKYKKHCHSMIEGLKEYLKNSIRIFEDMDFIKEIRSGEIRDLGQYKNLPIEVARLNYYHKWLPKREPVLEFPDGFAWYDVGKRHRLIGNMMGNCGSIGVMTMEEGASMLVLVNEEKEPMVIATYEPDRGAIRHIEGQRHSRSVAQEYWDKIKALAQHLGVSEIEADKCPMLPAYIQRDISIPRKLEDFSSPWHTYFTYQEDGEDWIASSENIRFRMPATEFYSYPEGSRKKKFDEKLQMWNRDPEFRRTPEGERYAADSARARLERMYREEEEEALDAVQP